MVARSTLVDCSLFDFLLYELVHLLLVHSSIRTLDDLAKGRHVFDLEPTRDEFSDLFNLPLAFSTINELAFRSLIELLNKHIHLHAASPTHLEDESDLPSQSRECLISLLVHLRLNDHLCLLLLLSHFVFDLLDHPKSLNGQTSRAAQLL